MASSQQFQPIFSAGVGYGLIIGLGAVFAIGMSCLSVLLARYMAEHQTSEEFLTAKHSVKTGLVASAVVSSWTIAATLLSSTTGASYCYVDKVTMRLRCRLPSQGSRREEADQFPSPKK